MIEEELESNFETSSVQLACLEGGMEGIQIKALEANNKYIDIVTIGFALADKGAKKLKILGSQILSQK
jgi:hypothetical protein